MLVALAGELERVLQDPVGAFPGKRGELGDDFAVGALIHPAADVAVLALGVLADHDVVDVAGLAAASGQGMPSNRRTGRRFT